MPPSNAKTKNEEVLEYKVPQQFNNHLFVDQLIQCSITPLSSSSSSSSLLSSLNPSIILQTSFPPVISMTMTSVTSFGNALNDANISVLCCPFIRTRAVPLIKISSVSRLCRATSSSSFCLRLEGGTAPLATIFSYPMEESHHLRYRVRRYRFGQ